MFRTVNMRPFEHLQILGNADIYEKISVVLKGLEPWLQGNAKAAEADENGIIQIWTDQIDQATLAIRRLIYEGVSVIKNSGFLPLTIY